MKNAVGRCHPYSSSVLGGGLLWICGIVHATQQSGSSAASSLYFMMLWI